MFNAGQTEIKKICYSAIRYGLTLQWPSKTREIFCCFCVNIPVFGWWFHVCFPNLIKFQIPYISTSLCVEKLRLNYFQGLGNTLLSQRYELRHEADFHNRQICGLSTNSLAPSFDLCRYNVPFLCIMCCMLWCNVSESFFNVSHSDVYYI